jgi:hypothetical protein
MWSPTTRFIPFARPAPRTGYHQYYANLNTQLNQFFDFLSHAVKYACINTEAF